MNMMSPAETQAKTADDGVNWAECSAPASGIEATPAESCACQPLATVADGQTVLADLAAGTAFTVSRIAASCDTSHKLTGLGIRRGVNLTVQRNTGSGPIVVGIGPSRVGLCRTIAQRISGTTPKG